MKTTIPGQRYDEATHQLVQDAPAAPQPKSQPDPAKARPAPKPPKPIDQAEHGRVRKPHGGASRE